VHIKYREHNSVDLDMSFIKNKKTTIILVAVFLLSTGSLVDFPAMADNNSTSTNSTSTPHSTATSITSNPTTVNAGVQVTLSISVSDSSNSPSTPSGTILLSDGNAGGTFNTASCTLSFGICTSTYTPSTNSPGIVTITASYGGDSSHSASSGSTPLTVILLHHTTTAVISNSTTVNTGGHATLTVSVSDTASSPTTPSGTILFDDGYAGGTFNLASCTLSSGSCTSTYAPTNSHGTVTITASYGGDSSHSTSSGSTHLAVTSLDYTATSITSNPTTISSGGSVALSISILDTSRTTATPSGTVSINDNNAGGTFNETSCTLSSGGICATLYTPSTNAPHAVTITVLYAGDNTHLSSSGSLQLSTSAPDSTIISIMPNPASFISGNATIFTATITDPSRPSANLIGLVSWSDNGVGGLFNADHCILVASHCSITYAPPPNSHSITITASYAGDTSHSGSSGSSSLSLAVQSTPNTTTTTPNTTPNTIPNTTPNTIANTTASQTMAPQATSPQTIATATPQEETMITNAETSQTIAAEVNLVNQTLQTTSIDNNVSVQANNISSDSINISVSATNQTGSKVILINLGNTTINVANLGYLGVMYDGKPIAPAADVNSLLHANSTSDPEYAIVVTQSGAQILVLIPHFSTHTITITNMSKVIPVVPEFPFVLPILSISIFSVIILFSRTR